MKNLKSNVLIVFIVVSLIGFTSCDKLKELASFETDVDFTVSLDLGKEAGDYIVASNEKTLNIQGELDDIGLSVSDAETSIEKILLTVVEPDGATFSNLSTVEVGVYINGVLSPLASKTGITSGAGAVLNLVVTSNANLLSALKQNKVKFYVTYTLKEQVEQVYIVKVNATFKIKKS